MTILEKHFTERKKDKNDFYALIHGFDENENYKKTGQIVNAEISQAYRTILATYGDVVSISDKKKSLIKFGKNPNVGTSKATIWYTGQDQANETYPAANTNSIDTVSAQNVADDGLSLVVEGHTESGGLKTFVSQSCTLTGQTKVTLSTPLNRCTRSYNDDSTDFTGEIYVYEDTAISSGKPSDTTKIHLTIPAGENQSEKASTSLANTDYWIVTSLHASLLKKSSGFAEVQMEVRLNGKVFRPVGPPIAVGAGDTKQYDFFPYVVVPKNADVRLRAKADTGSTEVSGGIQGYLASVV